MKTTELRIGNSIIYNGGLPEDVDEITIVEIADIVWLQQNNYEFNKYHKPIPLTKEWLLKFGFWRWRAGSRSWIINESVLDKIGTTTHRFYLATSSKKYAVKTGYYYEARTGYYPSTFLRYIKYVHQLQNLYFALTGEELEIKTNQNLKL